MVGGGVDEGFPYFGAGTVDCCAAVDGYSVAGGVGGGGETVVGLVGYFWGRGGGEWGWVL